MENGKEFTTAKKKKLGKGVVVPALAEEITASGGSTQAPFGSSCNNADELVLKKVMTQLPL
jgi:hypothetical protein